MNSPNSVILLPPRKKPTPKRGRPLPWPRWLAVLGPAVTAAFALGWAGGFFHGRQSAPAPEQPAMEEPAVRSPAPRTAPLLPDPTTDPASGRKADPSPVPASTRDGVTAPGPAPVRTPTPTPPPPRTTVPAIGLPASKPIPAGGGLRITSKPDQAEVYAGDRLLGKTPLLLADLPPGPYTFRVEKDRHTRKTTETRVWAGTQATLHVELQYDPEPRPGSSFRNSQDVLMVWIPALQGWAASIETTQKVYTAIAQENPSEQQGPDLPVTHITWSRAAKFCELLTLAERGAGFIPPGYTYQLPSDSEWSLLAAGTPLSQAITSKTTPREQPAPTGSLPANALGLHDIRGNVWEWCRDTYTGEVHRRELVENGTGDPSRVTMRDKILRGGSWTRSLESNLSIGYRLTVEDGMHGDYETGFRVVLLRTP
jgi:formylglycine-generating enzyme